MHTQYNVSLTSSAYNYFKKDNPWEILPEIEINRSAGNETITKKVDRSVISSLFQWSEKLTLNCLCTGTQESLNSLELESLQAFMVWQKERIPFQTKEYKTSEKKTYSEDSNDITLRINRVSDVWELKIFVVRYRIPPSEDQFDDVKNGAKTS